MIARPLAWARSLWRGLRRRYDVETEVDEEFRLHIEMRTEDLVRSGLTGEEARRRAHIEFGSVEKYKEQGRASRGLAPFDQLRFSLLDVRLGVRMLIKYPTLTIIGAIALAFAIFVGAAGFEVTTRQVFPRISFEHRDRIVAIENWDVAANRQTGIPGSLFLTLREELSSIEGWGSFGDGFSAQNLTTPEGRSEPLAGVVVSPSTFALTGVKPLLGRSLVEADEHPDAPAVIVVSYDVWRNRLGSDPGVVGSTVRLGDDPHTIVGVMPKGFSLPERFFRVWIPARRNPGDSVRGLLGRLAPRVTIEEAQAQLTLVSDRAAAALPEMNANMRLLVTPFSWDDALPGLRERVTIMSTNIFLGLLVVLICSTVALLVYARAVTRESEIAVRTALGAGRSRIVMQLVAESLVLAGIAAVIGLVAADVVLRWAVFWIDFEFGSFDGTGLRTETVLYAGVLTAAAAAILGILPALKITRGLAARLARATPGGGGFRFGGLWTAIVVTQVSVTVVVPVAFFFAIRDVEASRAVISNAGFPTEEYLAFQLRMVSPPAEPGVPEEVLLAERISLLSTAYRELERRLEADPRVRNVTFGSSLPTLDHPSVRIELDPVEGYTTVSGTGPAVSVAGVALDFFDTFNAPVVAGRGFYSGDLESDAPVVVVNPSFVARVLGGHNPIGRRLRYLETEDEPWREIVGVVRGLGLGKGDDPAAVYQPTAPGGNRTTYQVAMHVSGEPESFVPGLHTIAAEISPLLRLDDRGSVMEGVSAATLYELSRLRQRGIELVLWLSTLVTVVAVALSFAGIYAVMSFTVWQRTREIGLRVTLGANARGIIALIFRRPVVQVGIGVLIGGLVVAVLVSKGFAQVTVKGAALLVTYALLMTGVCLLAAVVPVRRTLSIEPAEVLKAET